MFVIMVAANASVLVVVSIPTGVTRNTKLPLAWAFRPKHCSSSCNCNDNEI